MSNRARLWSGVKESAGWVGLALLLTPGLPLIARVAKVRSERLEWLGALEPYGWQLLPLAPLLLLLLTGWRWYGMIRRQRQYHQRMETEGVTYLLLPRPDAPVTRADQVSLWQRLRPLLPIHDHLSFELSGSRAGLLFSLRTGSDALTRACLTQLMTEYPGMEARRVTLPEEDPLWTPPEQPAVWAAMQPLHREQPLVMATDDPLTALLGELALLPQGIRAGVQVLVREDAHTRPHLMAKAARVTSKKPETGPYTLRPSSAERREVHWLDTRAQESFVEAWVVLWACASDEGDASKTVALLADTLRGQYLAHNPLRVVKRGRGSRYTRTFPAFSGSPWTTGELGTLAHLAGGDTAALAPRLLRARGRPLPAPHRVVVPPHARIAPFLEQPSLDAARPSELLVVTYGENGGDTAATRNAAGSGTKLPMVVREAP